jgi:hypothetical protein
MPSTYSPDLRLELIANGEKTGTWGTITNINLGDLLEDAIAGVATVATSSAAQALTVNNGAVDQARCSVLSLSTVAASNFAVYVPPVPKLYVVKNADTTYNLTLYVSTIAGNTTAAGSGVTLPPGRSALLRSDGTNIVDQVNYISSSLTTGGNLTVGGNFSVTGTATLSANPTLALQAATKQYVDSIVAGGFPSGGIIMWSGSVASIPAGWLLCNGTSGTPDLRDRFIVGAGNTYAVGATGGSANAIVVSHTHSVSSSVSDPGHQHVQNFNNTASGNTVANLGAGSTVTGYVPSSGGAATTKQVLTDSSTTGISVSTSISSTGSSGTNANLPPYYALCFIMKA